MAPLKAPPTAAPPVSESPWECLRRPVLAPLLRHGLALRLTVGGCLGYAVLAMAGFRFIRCPVYALTGCDCPGCGLTRSVDAALHGHLGSAFHWHVFGPLALALGACGLAACFMPRSMRLPLADWLGRQERRCFLPTVVMAGFLAYWLARMSLGCLPSDLVAAHP